MALVKTLASGCCGLCGRGESARDVVTVAPAAGSPYGALPSRRWALRALGCLSTATGLEVLGPRVEGVLQEVAGTAGMVGLVVVDEVISP